MPFEFVPEQLDLFTSRPLILGVVDNSIVEHTPLNSLDGATSLVFESHAFNDRMKDLDHVHLLIKFKLMKRDGTAYTDADVTQPSLVNNFLFSMFKSAFITLNGVSIHSQEINYHMKEYIECGLNNSTSTIENRLSSQLFFADYEDERLKTIAKNSKLIEMYGKINLVNTGRLLLSGVSFGLRLNFETPDFFLNETGTKNAVIKITEAKLLVRHVNLNPELGLSIERKLQSNVATYEYNRGTVCSVNIPSGLTSLNVPNLYNGIRPNLAIFMMVDHQAHLGNISLNPWKMEPFGLQNFSFVFDGNLNPPNGYSFGGTDENYTQIFAKLYEALGYHNLDRSAFVTQENFKTNNFMIAHDLTAFSTGMSQILDPIQQVSIGVTGKFKEALTKPITCLLYLLLPSKFEIAANRSISVIY